MLTILGGRQGGFCDGLTRRNFLTIGGMGLGGATLADLLRLEARAGVTSSNKAIINVFLPGGPPHQDMWDLKPDAPAEIRGEFRPIPTKVPGIEICELFPKIASMMDKFAIIRTMADCAGAHDGAQCLTGYPRTPIGAKPSAGAWVSRMAGPQNPGIPAHLSLVYKTGHQQWGDPFDGGFLGVAHAPFRLVGGKNDDSDGTARNMVLKGITAERLRDRTALMQSLDRFRREAEATVAMKGTDVFHEQALGILTSSRLTAALDLSQEDPATLARYGKGDPEWHADGAPRVTENFLVARRLVEAGARYVSLNFSRWDWHGGNFTISRKDFPMLDAALGSLVEDLHERGMQHDVSVVCWGEFGRTPKINNGGGRDHWPRLSAAILAGGGMRTGQAIGTSNRLAEEPATRPVKFHEVFATLYHNMGLWPMPDRIFDLQGRPATPIEPESQPMRELV